MSGNRHEVHVQDEAAARVVCTIVPRTQGLFVTYMVWFCPSARGFGSGGVHGLHV